MCLFLPHHVNQKSRNYSRLIPSAQIMSKGLLCSINSTFSVCFTSAPFSLLPLLLPFPHSVLGHPNQIVFLFGLLLSPLIHFLPCHKGDLSKMQILYCYFPSQVFSGSLFQRIKVNVLAWNINSFMIRLWHMHPASLLCQYLISTHLPNTLSHL